jgi:methylenetetrahydrofolate reductase (NADH)
LASARSGLWIRDHLPGSIIPDAVVDRLARAKDPTVEGARICIDLLHELTEIPGLCGAHLMAARNLEVVVEVIAAARSMLLI